jgi:hypothetical protein
MMKFAAGVVVGIYIEQQYPGNTPPMKPVLDGIIRDIRKKMDEYGANNPGSKSSPT